MVVVALPEALPRGDEIPSDQRTVVAFLRHCPAGATVEDISAAAGLSRACTERCLNVLRASGVVRCEAARAWALTNLPVGALRELRAMRGYDAGPDAVSLDIAIAHRADA